jgi:hypothetical protein
MKGARFAPALALCLLLALLHSAPVPAREYSINQITDNVVLYTTPATTTDFSALLENLNRRIDDLQMNTGVYLDKRAPIYVVPDRKSYARLAAGKQSIVEFSDAFYDAADHRIYVRSADQILGNYEGILMHEYVHWYLDGIFLSTPLWFHEGLATQYGTPLGVDRYLYFVRERFWGNKMDLFELAYRYPEEKRDWEYYYLSSFFAVKYMREHDEKAWNRFWTLAAKNHRKGAKTRFTNAFASTYSSSLYEFNLAFSSHTRKLAYLYLVIGVNSIIFSLLPFVLVFALIRHRRRMKALPDLPEPEETEPPTSTDVSIPTP